ncbi:MAG: 16S rRNA pseudouridine(516) synthase [Ruminococcus sp.]
MDRIDKILVTQNFGSRKEVHKLIKSKAVTVDGELVTKVDMKVDPNVNVIAVSGQALDFKEHLYIMMNKPQGYVCATEDGKSKTVMELLPPEFRRKGFFPAGRLDKDTEGLLIITDDGDFAHRMLAPKKHVTKRYYVETDGEITEDTVKAFEQGIIFRDGTKCQPARLEIIDNNRGYVEICEGKFHQIKKMFNVCRLNVTFLKRISIGNLNLDSNLPIGECRELSKIEKFAIFVVK